MLASLHEVTKQTTTKPLLWDCKKVSISILLQKDFLSCKSYTIIHRRRGWNQSGLAGKISKTLKSNYIFGYFEETMKPVFLLGIQKAQLNEHWKIKERKKHNHWKKHREEPENKMQEVKRDIIDVQSQYCCIKEGNVRNILNKKIIKKYIYIRKNLSQK